MAHDPESPASQVLAPPAGTLEEAEPAGTALVVDDDPAVVALVADVLQRAGLDVVTANDAASALSVVTTRQPDLAIIDVVLPGVDGIELCTKLRAEDGLEHLPVLFLSALTDAPTKARGFAAGGVDYLPKPFRREELVARARTHLTQSRARALLRTRQEALSAEASAALAAAANAEAHLTSLLRAIPDAVFLKDTDGFYLDCNLAAAGNLGKDPQEVVGRCDRDLFPPEVAEELRVADLAAAASATPLTQEDTVPDLAGGTKVWETTRTPVYDGSGQLLGILGISRDLTERHHRRQEREAEQARLNDALEAAQAATWELDVAVGTIQISGRWLRMLGERSETSAALDLADWQDRVHPEDLPTVVALLEELVRGDSEEDRIELEYRMRHRSGRWLWQRDLARAVERDPAGRARMVRGLVLDVTQQLAHREQLDFAASHDGLTGLSNRQSFAEHLRDELQTCREHGGRLAVVTFDLDGFEAVNALHGRAGGNQLLVEIAMRLVDHLGNRDLVGRVGGDEFSVIVREALDGPDLRDRIEELHAVVSRPVQQQGRSIHATASIGVTFVPQARKVDADQLLRQADQAVYQAKLAGKDRYHVFDPADDAETRERYLLFSEIERAIAEDEFVLYYQPQVNLRTGATLGVEALIRWQHPQRGLLSPAAFIPHLAGHPLSIAVGDWVIEAAIAQLGRWAEQGWDTSISVNVDAAQLYDPRFLERLESQLDAVPTVRPDQLGLEILETGALVDLGHVSQLLTHLRALGVSSSLDDFGTGFSSLTLLKQLPADVIKIDRSFVMQVIDDPQHAVIIDSIVALCRSFHRTVLGEGVESEEQGQVLLELGCDRAQGFGIARPMPAEEIPVWRQTWQPPTSWATASAVSEDRVPGLIADLEHRAWLRDLDAVLRGESTVLPPLDPDVCRLGRWLQRERTEADRRQLRDVARIHRALHAEVVELLPGPHGDDGDGGEAEPGRARIEQHSQELRAALLAWRNRPSVDPAD